MHTGFIRGRGVVRRVANSSDLDFSYTTTPSSKTNLLPEAHDLEALEVVEVSPGGDLGTLLGVVAVVELLLDLLGLPLLLQRGGAGSARKLLEDEAGERQVGEGLGVAGDNCLGVGGRTFDKDLSNLC